ncbi:MAG: Methyltransferase type 12 [Solirubrobacterales bacterium]|nr:Methyltransferase type 12 [Solirubrobacterales bacterium]
MTRPGRGAGEDPIVDVVALGDGRDVLVARPRDSGALLDEEAFDARDEYLPYWVELWPSAIALARQVARRSLEGRRVLELGAGLGLPGLAAALGGAHVTLTDWAPEAVVAARHNAERNGVEVEALVVDWRSPEALIERAPWDLVLLADVLYEDRNVAPLLELLPRLAPEVLLADPGRLTALPFLDAAAQRWALTTTHDARVALHRLRLNGA